MKLSTFLHAVLPLIITLIAPTGAAPQVSPLAPYSNNTSTFLLRTCLVPGQDPSKNALGFENNFVYSYHTGAGLGDAALSPNQTDGWPAHFNGSELIFEYPNTSPYPNDTTPWAFALVSDGFYIAWSSVEINAAGGFQGGFLMDPMYGLVVDTSESSENPWASEWAGWMVCVWSHAVPQLFWYLRGYDSPYYPDSDPAGCAHVYLLPEYITS